MEVSRTSIRTSLTEGRLPYNLLHRDDEVEFLALDAESGEYRTFRVKVEGEHDIDGEAIPIFRFLGDPFHFIGTDKMSVACVPKGALALGGFSAKHVPHPKELPGNSRAIAIGLDYSFEYVNGVRSTAYARFVQAVTVNPKALSMDVEDFLKSVETGEGRKYVSPVHSRQRRMELIVETDEGTYLLTAEDSSGLRVLRRLGGTHDQVRGRASLPTLEVGSNLCFRPVDSKVPLFTEKIKNIKPVGSR